MKLNECAPAAQADPTYPKNWPREMITPACTRFGARYRVAKAFRKVSFSSGIETSTASTYSALVRFMTIYSAWEMFVGVFGLTSDDCLAYLEQKHPPAEVLKLVEEERKRGGTLLKFLSRAVSDSRLKSRIIAMLEGKEQSAVRIGDAIRHVYVHGVLTASPWKLSPLRVQRLVDTLSDYFLTVMDEESGDRANARLAKKKRG